MDAGEAEILTAADLAAIEARLAKAMRWPWHVEIERDGDDVHVYVISATGAGGYPNESYPVLESCFENSPAGLANAEFAAHAPEDIATLTRLVRDLAGALVRLGDEGQRMVNCHREHVICEDHDALHVYDALRVHAATLATARAIVEG